MMSAMWPVWTPNVEYYMPCVGLIWVEFNIRIFCLLVRCRFGGGGLCGFSFTRFFGWTIARFF